MCSPATPAAPAAAGATAGTAAGAAAVPAFIALFFGVAGALAWDKTCPLKNFQNFHTKIIEKTTSKKARKKSTTR